MLNSDTLILSLLPPLSLSALFNSKDASSGLLLYVNFLKLISVLIVRLSLSPLCFVEFSFLKFLFFYLHRSWAQFFNICVNIWAVNILHEGAGWARNSWGGPELKTKGPSLYIYIYFFFEKFKLLKFFFGPRGARAL